MRAGDVLKTSWHGITHAKVRSLLTMLGIVIGIASVILLMSIGKSAEQLIIGQVQGIGSNLVFVIPGGTAKGSRFASPASVQGIIIKTLVQRDLDALRADSAISGAAAETRGQAKAVFGNNDVSVTFNGISGDYFRVRNFNTSAGSAFTAEDINSFNRVAVLGTDIAHTLFGNTNPIGQQFRLGPIPFRVVGVLEKKGIGPGGIDQDSVVLIPISVAQHQLLGIDYFNFITVQANSDYDVEYVKSRITSILRQDHRVTDPNKDDFTIQTQEDALALLGSITSVMTVFLTAIASISLVVGGIGIMNIMLVSVVERTKEIGLRKALGATNNDILQQFLLEAVILTMFGGAIGIAIGAGLTGLAYLILTQALPSGWVFELPLSAILLAFGVSLSTGVVFGIYPARQASRKSPMEALRYE